MMPVKFVMRPKLSSKEAARMGGRALIRRKNDLEDKSLIPGRFEEA